MPNYPDTSVNGVRTSYCSIEFGVAGIIIPGIKSINYKDVAEIGIIRGTSANPIGRTRGNVSAEGDIEIYQEEWTLLLQQLWGLSGAVGYMMAAVPVHCTYAEPSQLAKTKRDVLLATRFHSADKSNAEGTDGSTIKLQMSIMQIRWNGFYPALEEKFAPVPV